MAMLETSLAVKWFWHTLLIFFEPKAVAQAAGLNTLGTFQRSFQLHGREFINFGGAVTTA